MGTLGRLTADQLDLTRDTFDFTQTITDTLGDLGTPDDGFDSYLNDTAILLATVGNPGDSLLDDLNLAASIGGSIDPLSLQDDATSLPASLATGASIVADANDLAGSVTEPTPPGGGGGGGGGGAPPPTSTCLQAKFALLTGFSQGVATSVTYTNRHTAAVTVKSVTADPAGQDQFSQIRPDVTGRTVRPGESIVFTVAILATPGSYQGKWTLNTDGPDPQPCIEWAFTATNPVNSGGTPPPGGLLPIRGGGAPPGLGPNG